MSKKDKKERIYTIYVFEYDTSSELAYPTISVGDVIYSKQLQL